MIPVFNTPRRYLEECFDSVIAQDYSDIEVVVVDDGSNQETANFCDQYLSGYRGKKKVVHQVNSGLSVARNCGVLIGSGSFFFFLDSDDRLVGADSISSLVAVAEAENVRMMVIGRSHFEKMRPRQLENKRFEGTDFFEICLKDGRFLFTAQDILYSRTLLESLKHLFVDGLVHEDEEFTPRAIAQSEVIVLHGERPTYCFHAVENSITRAQDERSFYRRCLGKLQVASLTLSSTELPQIGEAAVLNNLRAYSFANMAFLAWSKHVTRDEYAVSLMQAAEIIDYRRCPLRFDDLYRARTSLCMKLVSLIGVRRYLKLLAHFCR